MALSISITASGPATIATDMGPVSMPPATATLNCTVRVASVSGGKEGCDVLCSFGDAAAGASFVRAYRFVPSVADGAPNFIRQAYLHLKSLPEFASATDC